jgi:hypothetical protein
MATVQQGPRAGLRGGVQGLGSPYEPTSYLDGTAVEALARAASGHTVAAPPSNVMTRAD